MVNSNIHIQEISIRIAGTQDAETIADLSRKTFKDTFAPFNTENDMEVFLKEQFTRYSLITEVGVSCNSFYLAYAGEQLAGYVKLRERENPKELNGLGALEIARLYATQDMVGKGIGSRLMQHSINIARQKQKQVIWLAVWEKNKRALDFYLKWGFEIFGKQVFILGTDLQKDWLMKKIL